MVTFTVQSQYFRYVHGYERESVLEVMHLYFSPVTVLEPSALSLHGEYRI
jgi:hypothetical protein